MLKPIALLAVLLAQLPLGSAAFADDLEIATAAGAHHRFRVEVAATPDAREVGLMHRRSLADDAGMLFDFNTVQPVAMWMKNTFIPLDMLFLDAGGLVVHVAERAEPHSLTPIGPAEPVRGVLELYGGTAARLGLGRGDRVIHPVFAAPQAIRP